MMRATICVLATAAILGGAGLDAAHAQNVAAIKARQGLMKQQADATRRLVPMIRGEAPYDPATAQAALAAYRETTEKFGTLFPPDSKAGGETRALPEIWEERAEFDAALAKFTADVKAAEGRAATLAEFRPAFEAVTSHCNSCHELFRAEK